MGLSFFHQLCPGVGCDQHPRTAQRDEKSFGRGGQGPQVLTAGGRVLGVTTVGNDLDQAIAKAYEAAKCISFQDMHLRTDIGKV